MNSIGPEAETEAAIYAEGTRFSKADILKAYREHGEDIGMQAFCEEILGIPGVDDSGLREAGVYMPTSVLCRISGLSLEDWGLDEGCYVVAYPDRINATNESGLLIPDIASGNSSLEARVWAAAVRWINGGKK